MFEVKFAYFIQHLLHKSRTNDANLNTALNKDKSIAHYKFTQSNKSFHESQPAQ